jgi:stress-induced morphogen
VCIYVSDRCLSSEMKYPVVADCPNDKHFCLLSVLLLLVNSKRCLSGNTAEAIQRVDPQFIRVAKIEQSLTPGRNNGFLNMLKKMKEKALALDANARNGSESSSPAAVLGTTAWSIQDTSSQISNGGSVDGHGPKYTAIVEALQLLKPTKLELVDNSYQHAGHAGNDMDGESHFDLTVVASAFEGLNLVKRHQLIYMVLGDIMPQIHALQIQSLTPTEAEQRGL